MSKIHTPVKGVTHRWQIDETQRLDDLILDLLTLSRLHTQGLGLSISQQVVEVHGGRIQASNRPEKVLRVEIELPTPRSSQGNR